MKAMAFEPVPFPPPPVLVQQDGNSTPDCAAKNTRASSPPSSQLENHLHPRDRMPAFFIVLPVAEAKFWVSATQVVAPLAHPGSTGETQALAWVQCH